MRLGRSARKILAALAVIAAAGALSAQASASVLESPRNGAVIRWSGGFVWFDWRWSSGEYNGGVYIGRTRNFHKMHLINDWDVSSNAQAYVDSQYGDITRPGVYYWTVCAQTISGEDDKCYFHAPIWHFRVRR